MFIFDWKPRAFGFCRVSRREVARAVESSPGVDSFAISGSSVLIVQVKTARLEVERELKRLRRVEQMVVSDPETTSGTPVYRGTRIPVELVAAMMDQGASVEEILDGYPALRREQVKLAPLYVKAFPRVAARHAVPGAGNRPASHSALGHDANLHFGSRTAIGEPRVS